MTAAGLPHRPQGLGGHNPLPSNRLSSIAFATAGTRGFTYDAASNVVAEARPGGTYGYAYNAAGRMESFSINGFLQASYKYDAMGRQAIRTLTSPTAVTIHSVFDSEGRRIAEYNETSSALIREYVWNVWEPIAVIEGGVVSFVRADHIGRPVFATNSAGVKVWSTSYLPFGGVHVSSGALPSNRFPGQWFQSESGLHQNWMRDYGQVAGRNLQPEAPRLILGTRRGPGGVSLPAVRGCALTCRPATPGPCCPINTRSTPGTWPMSRSTPFWPGCWTT